MANNRNNVVDWYKMVKAQDNVPCKCPKCGHKWGYSGEKRGSQWVTCPDCDRKSPLNRLRYGDGQ